MQCAAVRLCSQVEFRSVITKKEYRDEWQLTLPHLRPQASVKFRHLQEER
jgi:hypothetical protein